MQQNDDDPILDQANDDLKHEATKPPSVLADDDATGGSPAEPMDIDAALADVGLKGDKYDDVDNEEGPEPLNIDDEIS